MMAPMIRAVRALPIRPPGGTRPYLWVKVEQFFVAHRRIETGCLVLEEEEPGLGLVPDWDALARHRTKLAEGTTDW